MSLVKFLITMDSTLKIFAKKILNVLVVAPLRFIIYSIKANKGIRDNTIHSVLWNDAIADSADYVKKYLPEVLLFDETTGLWDYAISKIQEFDTCDILEFGCYKGTSINYFSKKLQLLTFLNRELHRSLKLFSFANKFLFVVDSKRKLCTQAVLKG